MGCNAGMNTCMQLVLGLTKPWPNLHGRTAYNSKDWTIGVNCWDNKNNPPWGGLFGGGGGGGANDLCACVSTHMLGESGVCSPRKILQIRCSA